jgi:hypothetical protein
LPRKAQGLEFKSQYCQKRRRRRRRKCTKEEAIHVKIKIFFVTPLVLFAMVIFWRWDLTNYLPGLASNHDPPALSFSTS